MQWMGGENGELHCQFWPHQGEVDALWKTIRHQVDQVNKTTLMEPDQTRRLTRSLCMIAVDIYYVDENGASRLRRLCKEIKWQEGDGFTMNSRANLIHHNIIAGAKGSGALSLWSPSSRIANKPIAQKFLRLMREYVILRTSQ